MTYGASDIIYVRVLDQTWFYGSTTKGRIWLRRHAENPHKISREYTEDFLKTLDEHELTYEETARIPDIPK